MFLDASRQRRWLFLALLAPLFGCGEPESIETREVERTAPRLEPVDVEQARGELDHMLTAIVPKGNRAWFFKLVAKGNQIESLRRPFEQFVASVELPEGEGKPSWKLPEGWEEKPGDAMRAATITVTAGDEKLPLSVSVLPLADDWSEYIESNVNRWMNQLQQPPLPAGKVADLTRTTPTTGGSDATIIELVGNLDRTAMPGAMPAGHPPVDSATASTGAMPAGTAPRAAAAQRAAGAGPPSTPATAANTEFPKPKEFTYDPPAGWQPGRYGGMRTAAFNIAEDGQTAEVTVMPFPASGAMADPQAQAQRWAGQVGLEPSDETINAAKSAVTIDGVEGQHFVLLGPEGAEAQAVIAAMVRQGDLVWFFKMMGDRDLVESQREAFDKFLASIKFTG